MPLQRSRFFAQQLLMPMESAFKTALEAAITYIPTAPSPSSLQQAQANDNNPPDPHQVNSTQQPPIFRACNLSSTNLEVAAKRINHPPNWLLYYSDVGNTRLMMMIGRFAQQSGTSQLQDWFVWSPTPQQTSALAGNWAPRQASTTRSTWNTWAISSSHTTTSISAPCRPPHNTRSATT